MHAGFLDFHTSAHVDLLAAFIDHLELVIEYQSRFFFTVDFVNPDQVALATPLPRSIAHCP